MAYEVSDVELYQWGSDTLGAATVTHSIVGPRGKVGFVRDIIAEVTTALQGLTTVPEIQVGISSGDFTYGRYRLGTTTTAAYGVGPHRASQEAWTGLPPRTLNDFAGHVVLDGGPYGTQGIAGGSFGTQVPLGRIPASGFTVVNVISGTAGVDRVFLNPLGPLNQMQPAKDLKVGQTITVQGVAGVNATVNGVQTISAIDPNFQWIELTGTVFSGAYTSGGIVFINVVVTLLAGVGTPLGAGFAKVKIQWVGAETV